VVSLGPVAHLAAVRVATAVVTLDRPFLFQY